MSRGVAGAIKRKGGKIIEDEALSHGPVPLGEAIVTGAGALKARYVIHAACMMPGMPTTKDAISNAVRNSLLRAEEKGLKSVAFPAMATGVAGFPYAEDARAMLSEVISALSRPTSLELVVFAFIDDKACEAFMKELEKYKLLTTDSSLTPPVFDELASFKALGVTL